MAAGGGAAFSIGQIAGYRRGMVVGHSSATAVKISPGEMESDGGAFALAATATHTMTSLATAFGLHYVYLDKSASSPSSPVFYDSTAVPTNLVTFGGWYHPTNNDDRLVGVVPSPSGSAIVAPFTGLDCGNRVRLTCSPSVFGNLSTAQLATAVWATPNVQDVDVITPPSAVEALICMYNTAPANSRLILGAIDKERGDAGDGFAAGQMFQADKEEAEFQYWLTLGASRKIYIAGENDDLDNITTTCRGFAYET